MRSEAVDSAREELVLQQGDGLVGYLFTANSLTTFFCRKALRLCMNFAQLSPAFFLVLSCSSGGESSPDPNRGSEAEDSLSDANVAEARQEREDAVGVQDESGGGATSDLEMGASQDCVALTAEPYENNEGNDAEFTAKFFPTSDRNGEYIDMFFRSDELGTHQYGEGDNADLYTCRQCLFIVRNDSTFYPVSGSITIEEGSDATGTTLVAKLSELTLVEIEISDSYHSIPVVDGECVTLAATSIDAR